GGRARARPCRRAGAGSDPADSPRALRGTARGCGRSHRRCTEPGPARTTRTRSSSSLRLRHPAVAAPVEEQRLDVRIVTDRQHFADEDNVIARLVYVGQTAVEVGRGAGDDRTSRDRRPVLDLLERLLAARPVAPREVA